MDVKCKYKWYRTWPYKKRFKFLYQSKLDVTVTTLFVSISWGLFYLNKYHSKKFILGQKEKAVQLYYFVLSESFSFVSGLKNFFKNKKLKKSHLRELGSI